MSITDGFVHQTAFDWLRNRIGLDELEMKALCVLEKQGSLTVKAFTRAVHCSKDTLYNKYCGMDSLVSGIRKRIENWLTQLVSVSNRRIHLNVTEQEYLEITCFCLGFSNLCRKYISNIDYHEKPPFTTLITNLEREGVGRKQVLRLFFVISGIMTTVEKWALPSEIQEEQVRTVARDTLDAIHELEGWMNSPIEKHERKQSVFGKSDHRENTDRSVEIDRVGDSYAVLS